MSIATLVEVAVNKYDGASLRDSSSTPTPKPYSSPSTYADICGSNTIIDALEIGGNTGTHMK